MLDGVVVGQINLDVGVAGFQGAMVQKKESLVEGIRLQRGGDAQNAACAMAGLGMRVALAGRIGRDAAGELCVAGLEEDGVDCSALAIAEGGATGACVALLEGGEATFLYNPGENARLSVRDIPFFLFEQAGFVSLHSLFALPALDAALLFEKAREQGCFTFADTTNVKPENTAEEIRPVLPLLDVFAPSYAEAKVLLGENDPEAMAAALLKMGVKTAVIKLGEQGCLAANVRETVRVPGFAAKVVDTTGAGDNFCAGFLYGRAKGLPLRRCCALGNAAGAVAVSALGGCGARQSAQVLEKMAAET